MILPETAKTEAFAVAEKVRVAIAGMSVELGAGQARQPVEVRVSIGAASARPGSEPLELLEAADRALYQAKAMGRDQVRLAAG